MWGWPSTTKLWTKLIDFLFPLVIYIDIEDTKMFSTWQEYNKYILYKLDIVIKPCGACTLALFSLVDQKSYEIHYSWVATNHHQQQQHRVHLKKRLCFFWEILLILGWWWPYYYTKVALSISHLTNKKVSKKSTTKPHKVERRRRSKVINLDEHLNQLPILRCTQSTHFFSV